MITEEERQKMAATQVALSFTPIGSEKTMVLQCRLDELQISIMAFIKEMIREGEAVGVVQKTLAPPRGDA